MPSPEEITRHHDADPEGDPWVNGPPMPDPVVIVDYNPEWPQRFSSFAASVRSALGATVVDLEHVGSTSVPGLAAKDVIDLDLTVTDSADESAYVRQLEAAGWQLTIREPWWHEHRCFRHESPRANLHVFSVDCPETIRHRMFRDWLREHADDRAVYEQAKRDAVPGGGHVMDYNLRKQGVIREIYERVFRAAGLL